MKQLKYIVLLFLILAVEAVLIFGMFAFVTAARPVYIFFALALMLGGIAYLIISRYRERVKIKPKAEVLNGYIKVLFIILMVVVILLLAVIVIRALVFVIRGS